jgi:hypothetical protein
MRNDLPVSPFLEHLLGNTKEKPDWFNRVLACPGFYDHDDAVDRLIRQLLGFIAAPAIEQPDKPASDVFIAPRSLLAVRRKPEQQVLERFMRKRPLSFHEMNALATTYLAFWENAAQYYNWRQLVIYIRLAK